MPKDTSLRYYEYFEHENTAFEVSDYQNTSDEDSGYDGDGEPTTLG